MRLAVLDLETTGIDPLTARIVEVAIVSESGGTLFHSYVNPGVPVPEEATAVHGYTGDFLAKYPKFRDIAAPLRHSLEGRTLAGYNALAYDVPLLNCELKRVGLDPLPLVVVDGLLMWQQLEDRKLVTARRRFCGKDLDGAHTALADAVATAEVIAAIAAQYSLPDDAPLLAERFVPPAKISPDGVLMIGKHKGRKLADIDVGYRRWMLNQDFDEATKAAVRASLG